MHGARRTEAVLTVPHRSILPMGTRRGGTPPEDGSLRWAFLSRLLIWRTHHGEDH